MKHLPCKCFSWFRHLHLKSSLTFPGCGAPVSSVRVSEHEWVPRSGTHQGSAASEYRSTASSWVVLLSAGSRCLWWTGLRQGKHNTGERRKINGGKSKKKCNLSKVSSLVSLFSCCHLQTELERAGYRTEHKG